MLHTKHDYSQVAKLARRGLTRAEISKKTDIPPELIFRYRKKHNISVVNKSCKYDYSLIPTLVKKGLTKTEIARKTGIPYNYVRVYCKNHNLSE